MDINKLTPMMKQYIKVKEKYRDCILFFRLGDFYEMFFEDAIVASKTLEIALTKKACGLDEKAPMCGVPFHSCNSYISKLVENGFKVAIAEQMTEPTSKGIVERDVVRVVTPGTVLEDNLLENKKNNYLMSIFIENDDVSLSFVDITTGEISSTFLKKNKLIEEIAKISPTEILINDAYYIKYLKEISIFNHIYINENFDFSYLNEDIVYKYFTKDYIDSIKDYQNIKNSLSILLNYIYSTQKQITNNINSINLYNTNEYMVLDMATRINLELTSTIRGNNKKGSLINILDKTSTSMGARLLRKYIEEPLINKDKINERLNIIEEIKDDFMLREDLINSLKNIYDIERICSKIAFEKVTPKEMLNLKYSLEKLPILKQLIKSSDTKILKTYIEDMDDLRDLYNLLDSSILEEPSISIKEGNIIKSSFNKELESLRDISKNGAFMIKEIENKEKEKTGIKSLKIGFNKVFGYYIEITKTNLNQINLDETYIRKQTLSNAERFITEELKDIEDKILNAQDKIKTLEYDLFVQIRDEVYKNIEKLQKISKIIANIDVFVSLATVAYVNNYVKPILNNENKIEIINGRHPVVEDMVGEENFIKNDTILEKHAINLITGPNMAGKSTYMRQTAIICLMAHIGSFVPCEYANISILDRIFTRVGASDDLSKGQSTFMVEMSEVSNILENATEKSLVILDEIGRGTSTYDGISLAWSIVEYIQKNIKAKTLFATHYHELTLLEEKFNNIKNYSVQVKEENDNVVFLRKIQRGPANKSYGINVAKLAKLPDEVIQTANIILNELENKENKIDSSVIVNQDNDEKIKETTTQLSFECTGDISLKEEILKIDLMKMNIGDIINALYNLQLKVKS